MSEWISVKDRLPEEGAAYLVVVLSEAGRWVQTSNWIECMNTWGCNCKAFQVTHWMPLPEPPKEARS